MRSTFAVPPLGRGPAASMRTSPFTPAGVPRGPEGMDLDMQLDLFDEALSELARASDLVNQVLEISIDTDDQITILRYELPSEPDAYGTSRYSPTARLCRPISNRRAFNGADREGSLGTVEAIVKTDASSIQRLRTDQLWAGAMACRGEQGAATAQQLGNDVDFDLVEGALFQEGHLQLPASHHPYVTILEGTQLGDEGVDVAAHLEIAFRAIDRPRSDDKDPVVLIAPGSRIVGKEIVGAASHDESVRTRLRNDL